MVTKTSMTEKFLKGRSVGVPIMVINTPDERATLAKLTNLVKHSDPDAVQLVFNIVDGLTGLNEAGCVYLSVLEKVYDPALVIAMLYKIDERGGNLGLPEDGIVYFLMSHVNLTQVGFVQALKNARDQFKRDGRTIVLLISGGGVGIDLTHDTIVFNEDWPTPQEYHEVIEHTYGSFNKMAEKEDPKLIETLLYNLNGTPLFAAEQLCHLSFDRNDRFSMDRFWELREEQLTSIKGLSYDKATETFDNIGGLTGAKDYLTMKFKGRRPPRVVIRIEELDKICRGMSEGQRQGDSNGLGDDAQQVFLSNFQDHNLRGILVGGPAGTGKSLIAKAAANTFGVRCILMDVNAAKGSLVGESEANIRRMFDQILAIGGEDCFFIASTNDLDVIPSPLRSRFGVKFLVDVPDADDRRQVWDVNLERYEISTAPSQELLAMPYVGREIQQICAEAWENNTSVDEAARWVSCAAISDPEKADSIRKAAVRHNLLAASTGEKYVYKAYVPPAQSQQRKIKQ